MNNLTLLGAIALLLEPTAAAVCLSPQSGAVEIGEIFPSSSYRLITFDGEVVDLMATSESVKVSSVGTFQFEFAAGAANDGEDIKFGLSESSGYASASGMRGPQVVKFASEDVDLFWGDIVVTLSEGFTSAFVYYWAGDGGYHAVKLELDESCAGAGGAALTCPTGFDLVESGGYRWCYAGAKVYHDEAREACESHGLQLLELRTADKAAAVEAASRQDYAWLGITCAAQDESCYTDLSLWRWLSDGADLSCSYVGFVVMENGAIFGGGGGQWCAHWWNKPGKAQWAPHVCARTSNVRYGTACELPSSEDECTPPSLSSCDRCAANEAKVAEQWRQHLDEPG